MPELRFTRRAKQDLSDLPPAIRGAVLETIDLIAREPGAAGKQLVGRMSGIWSARVGNYRVLYTIEPSLIIVRAIRHRAVAYNRRE